MNLIKMTAVGVLGWLAYKALTRRPPPAAESDLQQRRRQADAYDHWVDDDTPEREPPRRAQSSRGFGR